MSSTQKQKTGKGKSEKRIDPQAITGYLLAGMVLYGGLGWLIDRWADTSNVFAPIGVVFGLAAGLFLTLRQVSVLERQEREALLRKRRALADTEDATEQQDTQDQQHPHDR
jgi:ATP synthase protein I